MPDYDLGIRGKLVRSEKTVNPTSLSFCTILYGLSVADEVTDTPVSNAANGYPDALLTPTNRPGSSCRGARAPTR